MPEGSLFDAHTCGGTARLCDFRPLFSSSVYAQNRSQRIKLLTCGLSPFKESNCCQRSIWVNGWQSVAGVYRLVTILWKEKWVPEKEMGRKNGVLRKTTKEEDKPEFPAARRQTQNSHN